MRLSLSLQIVFVGSWYSHEHIFYLLLKETKMRQNMVLRWCKIVDSELTAISPNW